MNLKTSLFSKTIFKSDIKRFWWLSVLNFIALSLFFVYPLYERSGYRNSTYRFLDGSFTKSIIYGHTVPTIFIAILFSLCAVLLVFSYLNNTNTVSFAHGLPVRRETQFWTHLISGFTLVLMPVILTVIFLLLMRMNPDFKAIVSKTDILKWLYVYIVYLVVAFMGSVFSCFLTGNAFAAIGAAGVISLTPLVLIGFWEMFLEANIYGYSDSGTMLEALKYIYIMPEYILGLRAIIYWGLGVVLLISSYFMYKNRHLENHGEVIAFPVLRPLFISVIAVLAGVLGYMYCEAVSSSSSMWWILPFGFLGIIISFMLSKKSLNLKGVWKPLGIFAVVFAVFFVVVKFDLTGYERRVPDLSKVEGVLVTQDYIYNYKVYNNELGEVKPLEIYTPAFNQKDDIENVIKLHKYMIEHREKKEDEAYVQMPITYTLTGGKIVQRYYTVPRKECYDYLKKIYESEEIKYSDYSVTDPTEKEVFQISITDSRKKSDGLTIFENDRATLDKLTEAYKKDIEALTYENDYQNNVFAASPTTRISFLYTKPCVTLNGEALTKEQLKMNPFSDGTRINENYVNTVAVLKELGFYDDMYTASDIKTVGINVNNTNYREYKGVTYSTEVVYESYVEPDEAIERFEKKITDKAQIEEIYDFVFNNAIYDNNRGNYSISLCFVTDKGSIIMTLLYDEDKVPDTIKNILQI